MSVKLMSKLPEILLGIMAVTLTTLWLAAVVSMAWFLVRAGR